MVEAIASSLPSLRLILASASPRRQSLLRDAGYSFVIHPANIDEETYPPGLSPAQLAEYLASQKAESVAAKYPDDVTLGSDTIVALGDRLLGKPADAADARQMLSLLSGTIHQLTTGVAVIHPATVFRRSLTVTSTVQMRLLSGEEIDRYVAGGQWQGKAGGYGIQDNDPFVINMGGSLTNIVGLPMEATIELLCTAGIFPADDTMRR